MASIIEMLRKARRGLEKVVAPGSNVSYAQAGEDLVLDFLINYQPTGFYVDVGCNHPSKGSNSFRFYRKGWRGVVIDANADFGPAYRRVRPRDAFVAACVSDTVAVVDFHVFKGDALSSISGKSLYNDPEKYTVNRVEQLTTRRLDDILATENAPPLFEFLSIDVEGHDEAVLRSIDLERFSPHVILIELNDAAFDPSNASQSWAATYLAGQGYDLIAMHWGNLFFRRSPA